MKKNIKKYFLLIILVCSVSISFSQIAPAAKAVLSADSIKSGNTKDILTSFFQLGLNNLTGPNKEFSFSSNPFAIMLKRNPNLALDRSYKRYKPLRKLNFDFGIRLDSSFNFNGFTSGIKYSLIDQTDATTSKFILERLRSDALFHERDKLMELVAPLIAGMSDTAAQTRFTLDYANMSQNVPFSKLDPDFQKAIVKLAADNNLVLFSKILATKADSSLEQLDTEKFKALKNSIKNKLLWTISIKDSTYKDKFEFANIGLYSELSKGIFEPEPGDNNLEINVKAAYTFSQDILSKDRNLNRKIFSVESGLNWVIRDKSTDRPFFELKFSGSYYRNFGNLYLNEKKDSLTLNGTARIRILDDIWIPLEIKYDPKTGKVFGFLNIKANFSGLGKLLKNNR